MILTIQIIYCLIILIAVPALISMEYYARQAKVSAAPSVPWMRQAVIYRLKQEVSALGHPAPVILELGSGWGTLAFAAANACPHAQIRGFEISPVPLYFARLKKWLGRYQNVTFYSQDFFDVNMGDAHIALAYLNLPLMDKLRIKFEDDLKPDSVVISNTFAVPGWRPCHEETIQNFIYTLKIYTYRVPHLQVQRSSN
ncbi:MAG: methyltransferase domain-containing protein [Alphaproteobacteria bacterium]|nr:methyltransferase domain-containing protein [Alphaproteobacteria bacterium]